MTLLLACIQVEPPVAGGAAVTTGTGEVAESAETAPGPEVTPWDLYDDTLVHRFDITLSDDAINQLAAYSDVYVEGTFTYGDEVYDRVGVRLKGSASFQPIDQKPALRLDFDQFVEGQEFHGYERMGLHNNVWDASAMAETLAYRAWRLADNPAPRTGYADVYINGELRGLYTIVQPMDGQFVEEWWEGPHGALYEMTRACDFNVSCDCYELQYDGLGYDPEGIWEGCYATAEASVGSVSAAFDWPRLVRYLALEKVLNHPDSYSYNLNNYHIYVDPVAGNLTLTPWGADSTFVYVYPPWDLAQPCEPTYLDVDYASSYGWLARWCEDDADCRVALFDEMLSLATLLEDVDLAGLAAATHDRIREHVAADPRVAYSLDDHDYQAACFVDWIGRRPDEVRALVAARR